MPFNPETDTVTRREIEALRAEAIEAGDLDQEWLCNLALEGASVLDGAEEGTAAHDLIGVDPSEAWVRCAEVIYEARGERAE